MFRAALCLALLSAAAAQPQAQGVAMNANNDHRASGHFDVQLKPATPLADGIARFSMTKTFHGELEGSSTGEMLSSGDPKAGSAGYVAIERVTGTMEGRTGGFTLQQYGTMDAGKQELKVIVVPGSGTGEFRGIAGDMTIDPAANHAYVLTYRLPR